jgi:hypothetical protein
MLFAKHDVRTKLNIYGFILTSAKATKQYKCAYQTDKFHTMNNNEIILRD